MLRPQENKVRQSLKLDGIWKFRRDRENIGVKKEWFQELKTSESIAVPGSWNSQAVETDEKEFQGVGWYEHTFFVPESYQNHVLYIYLEGVCFGASLWVNSQFSGESNLPFLPITSEVTNLIQPGRNNRITIAVDNRLGELSIPPGKTAEGKIPSALGEGQTPWIISDWYPFGGIHRSVWLVALPESHITEVDFRTERIAPHAELAVDVVFSADVEGSIEARLEQNGHCVATISGQQNDLPLKMELDAPQLWSPESPVLYDLVIECKSPTNTLIDQYQQKVGIRTVRVEGQQLLLNDKPISLRGFSRHEDFPVIGRGTMDSLIIHDTKLLQWTGANSYRTAHYPHDSRWLDQADECGLLVIDEVAAGTLTFDKQPKQLQKLQQDHEQHIRALIARDRNHPSVILWSLANEPDTSCAESKPYFQKLIDVAHQLDPTRPVTVVTNHGTWMNPDDVPGEYANPLVDVVCVNRYFGWYNYPGLIKLAVEAFKKDLDQLQSIGKPVLLSEFGAECQAGLHDTADRQFTEEYQANLIMQSLKALESKSWIIGAHIWCFADFLSAQNIARVICNNKGAFTRIRTPKYLAWALRHYWTGNTFPGQI